MDTEEKIFYNEATAVKLGWFPSWFGVKVFNEGLVKAIKKWQKAHKLKADGLVGPTTFRRLYAERESLKEDAEEKRETANIAEPNFIIYNGGKFPIKWDKVVNWESPLPMLQSIYIPSERTYYKYDRGTRDIKFFVNHWDASLSAASTTRILDRRNLSVHFCIDNDGTIFQLVDMQHAAKHAGRANRKSVGVEISNAYYLKYQRTYKRRGFGERPVIRDATVHGVKLPPFTGFYPVQIEALKALWVAVSEATDIPLECPLDENNELVTRVDARCVQGTFEGFINHYNLSRKKIDCAGLELDKLLQEIKDEKA